MSHLGSHGLVVVAISADHLGEVLQQQDGQDNTHDHQDEEGHISLTDDGADSGNHGLHGNALCGHTHGHTDSLAQEDTHQSVTDGEGDGDDTHDGTLTTGEPLTDQDADDEGGPDDDQQASEEVAHVPQGAGSAHHNAEGSNDGQNAHDDAEAIDALELTDEGGSNDLDHHAQNSSDGVDLSNALSAVDGIVVAAQCVHGPVGKADESDVGQELINHQDPAAGAKALNILIHFVSPQKSCCFNHP